MSHSKIKNLSLASAVAMTLALPVDSQAAVDMFLKFDDVAGESQVKGREGWIEVLAWSWGLSADNRGATCAQNISVTKYIDSSTDELVQAIPAKEVFSNARLVVRKLGEEAFDYIEYDMTNVKITSVSTGGSGGEDRLTENVAFSFEELEGNYRTANGAQPQSFMVPGNCK